jgi:hypothetical protein
MTRERKDRSANWLIECHGISLLRLVNITGYTSWQACQSVLSFPKQMPDGLLDVKFPARVEPDPFLIEIETYPDREVLTQLREDIAMVLLTRGVLPDVLLIVLFPKGNYVVEAEHALNSMHGLTGLSLRIRVINLWEMSAEDLFAANDVGLIPWIPLTKPSDSPEAMLQRCRERIEQQAPPGEKGNLLATTHVMAEMRYNNLDLLTLLGGHAMTMQKIFDMSPTIQKLKADAAREAASEALREAILSRLEKRFGSVPEDLTNRLRGIRAPNEQQRLLAHACDCSDLDAFRASLTASA